MKSGVGTHGQLLKYKCRLSNRTIYIRSRPTSIKIKRADPVRLEPTINERTLSINFPRLRSYVYSQPLSDHSDIEVGKEAIKTLENEKCKRDPRDELSYSFWTAIDVTFRARKKRSTSRGRHSDKKHLIMASCIIFFPNLLFPHMSPTNTPIPFRLFSSHWTLSRPFTSFGRLADGRTREIGRGYGETEDAATLRVPQNHDPHWYAIER